MSLIDDIRKDREAGSGRDWTLTRKDPETGFLSSTHRFLNTGGWYAFAKMPSHTVASDDFEHDHHDEAEANARRIARVPEMEAALIAADELAKVSEGLQGLFPDQLADLQKALNAYKEATK